MKKRPLTSDLGVLRRDIFSQADEKMMERFREIADPSVTSSERGDQTATRCAKPPGRFAQPTDNATDNEVEN